MQQRVVDSLGFAGGRSGIHLFNARACLFDHVAHARARPRAHSKEDIVHKTERVEPQHGRIDPAIDRNEGGAKLRGLAGRRRAIADVLAPLEQIAANSPNLVVNHDARFEVDGEIYVLPRYLFVEIDIAVQRWRSIYSTVGIGINLGQRAGLYPAPADALATVPTLNLLQ